MHIFEYYLQAWIVYVILGILVLFLLDLKLKHKAFAWRVTILTFIATFALVPAQVENSTHYAPMILTTLFAAEEGGLTVLLTGLVTLFAIWGIACSTLLAGKQLIDAVKVKQNQKHSQ